MGTRHQIVSKKIGPNRIKCDRDKCIQLVEPNLMQLKQCFIYSMAYSTRAYSLGDQPNIAVIISGCCLARASLHREC